MVRSILLLEFCVTEMPHCRRLLFLFLLLRRVSITISKRLGAKGEAMSGSGSCAIPGLGVTVSIIGVIVRCVVMRMTVGHMTGWSTVSVQLIGVQAVSVGHVHFGSRVCRPRALGSRVGEATCTFSHVTLGQTHTEVQGHWVTLYSLMARF